ncbi:hypothetical protein RJ640_002942 [Escallonia rubra]|uniref:PH domain-containing protein n=1 Tax=Escallonia rubra TaxID=112253 RepID=A0AA88UKS3_9ASTE|nr:hypothetical protein RJ640_002942 [Escallonia rubra]
MASSSRAEALPYPSAARISDSSCYPQYTASLKYFVTGAMLRFGYRLSRADYAVFIKRVNAKITILIVYVYDISRNRGKLAWSAIGLDHSSHEIFLKDCATGKGKLLWFKDPSCATRGSTPRGVVSVAQCLVVKGAEDAVNKPFAFEVSTESDTMYYVSDTEKEKEDWINSIGRSIVQRSRSVTESEGITSSSWSYVFDIMKIVPMPFKVSFKLSSSSDVVSSSDS